MREKVLLLIFFFFLITVAVLSYMSCFQSFYKTEKSVNSSFERPAAPGKEGDKENGGGTTKEKGGGKEREEKQIASGTETSLEKEKGHKNENKGKEGNDEEKGNKDDITEKKESVNEEVEEAIELAPPPPPLSPPFLSTHSSKPLQIFPPTAPWRHPEESVNEDGSGSPTEKGGEEGTDVDGPDTCSSGEEEKDENEEKEKGKKEELLENANDYEKGSVAEEVETIVGLMSPPPPLLPLSLSTHSLKPLRILPPIVPSRQPKESVVEDGGGLTTKEKEEAEGTEGKIHEPDTYSSEEDGNEKENVNEKDETIVELTPSPPPTLSRSSKLRQRRGVFRIQRKYFLAIRK